MWGIRILRRDGPCQVRKLVRYYDKERVQCRCLLPRVQCVHGDKFQGLPGVEQFQVALPLEASSYYSAFKPVADCYVDVVAICGQ